MVSTPILELKGLHKVFPNGTVALAGVDLALEPGSVHGLLGANGAGKSTLIKILSGAIEPTRGELRWKGEVRRWRSPREARAAGIATIFQHVPLVPTLSVRENIDLASRGWWRASGRRREAAAEAARATGVDFDLDRPVGELSIGQRQMVSIAQAMAAGADLVVMDEPTASLAREERQTVYRLVRGLANAGKAVLFVSHFLDEIVSLTDEVTVLRDGRAALRARTASVDEASIAAAIAGAAIETLKPTRGRTQRPSFARIAVSGPRVSAELELGQGQVVGLAGLLGSGRSELLHGIFGSDREASASILLDGRLIDGEVAARLSAGIALVPEDRAGQGYAPNLTLAENVSLARLGDVSSRWGLIDSAAERQRALEAIERLGIRARGPDALLSELSGGNAQKVVLAKWLDCRTRLLLLDEPTAGIDVGSRLDILRQIRRLAAKGVSVLLVSSDFDELVGVCDRILVLRDGAVVAERHPADVTEEELILLAGQSQSGKEMAA